MRNKSIKRVMSVFLVLMMMGGMLPGTSILSQKAYAVGGDEDYALTLSGGSFKLNGAGDYLTLAAALAACTDAGGDGELVIKLGSEGAPLSMVDVAQSAPGNNQLITATYTGSVEIPHSGNNVTAGLVIPNGVTATFRGLILTNTGTPGGEFNMVYLTGSGSLNIEEGTSITAPGNEGTCVFIKENGRMEMTGGSLSAFARGTVCNEGGTVIISGGTIISGSANGPAVNNKKTLTISGVDTAITGHYIAIGNEGVSAATEISGGTIEAASNSAKTVNMLGGGTVTITGGVVRATATSDDSDNYGIYNDNGTLNISGGTVSSAGQRTALTSAIYVKNSSSVNISGTASIIGTKYGIYNASTKTSGNGAVYLNGGTVRANGVGEYGAIGISNQTTGLVTIAAGTVEANYTASVAVENKSTGTIEISGGTVQGIGTTLSHGMKNQYGGTLNVSGGIVSSAGTIITAAAIDLGRISGSTISTAVISGTARIISANNNTVKITRNTTADVEKITVFGKSINSDTLAEIVVTGATVESKKEINADNYGSATVTAANFTADNSFIGWMSDSARTVSISNTNGATISSLTTGDNAAVTDVYLKAGVPPAVPTAIPTGGSFTDTDDNTGQIGGSLNWTAASPADEIIGYKVYWGSNTTTRLAGHTDVLFTVSGAAIASQVVAANTALPAGATHFLVYSYNDGGNSTDCLAVALTDNTSGGIAPDYTITSSDGKFYVNETEYASLAAALAACTEAGGDGELVIKLGATGTPLMLDQADRNSPANNQLITASYTGNVQIQNQEVLHRLGLFIPNAVIATFKDLTITQTGTAGSAFNMIELASGGTLNIEEGTSLTVSNSDGKGIYNNGGIVKMTEGTLAATGDSAQAIHNYDAGTVNISGGTISASGTNTSDTPTPIYNRSTLSISGTAILTGVRYGVYNYGNDANMEISGGTIEATGANEKALYSAGTGTINMTGGVIRATDTSGGSTGNNHGIYNNNSIINISGGTVSCVGQGTSNAAAVYLGSNATANISGTANITGARYGIYNGGVKTSDNGAVYINGGTVTATGVDGNGGLAINNQGTGLVTIAGGIVEVAGSDAKAVNNNNSGTISITGGTVQATNSTDNTNYAVSVPYGGTVNISGGTVFSAGTGSSAAAIKLSRSSGSTVSTAIISGTPRIISASSKTMLLYKNSTAADVEKCVIFGKAINSDTLADIVITGATVDGKKEINSTNYSDAAITASSITFGNSFIGWMSDSARTTSISNTNGATVGTLTTGANAGVTDIYLKAGVPIPVPTVLATNGSFTDTDTDENQIGGTISWTAASPTDGIDGYKIYWGSDTSTKLEGNDGVVYTVAGATTESQAVAADTVLPAGATHFLIYSYNISGISTSCLAVPISDVTGGGTAAEEPSGSGDSEQDAYQVDTAGNLVWMAANNTASSGFAGKYFKLTADIDLASVSSFTPIGVVAQPFAGTYDGNNKTLSNLKIGSAESPDDTLEYLGLFGNTDNATIKDLSIIDAALYTSSGQSAGVLSAVGRKGTISNVNVSGTIVNSSSGASSYTGGLIGEAQSDMVIRNSSSAVNVTVENGTFSKTGGFVGVLFEQGTIDNCNASGTVIGGANSAVGGFAGVNRGTTLNSWSTGDVTGGGGTDAHVGGFAGQNSEAVDTIKNSFATGNVAGGNEASIGGFVGHNTKRVINSYASGSVTGGANAIIGGFAGQNIYQAIGGWVMYNGELINTYHNSNVMNTAVGNDTGTRESSEAITEAKMKSASGQAGALVDIMNSNRGSNADWHYWKQQIGVNNGFPSMISEAPSPVNTSDTGGGDNSNNVTVTVDGQTQQQGASFTSQTQNGRTTTTATLDSNRIINTVNSGQDGSRVTVPIAGQPDVAVGKLNGQLVKAMENKQAIVEVKTESETYTLPAQEINIDAISAQLGQDVNLADIEVSIEIAKTSEETVKVVEDSASKGNFSIVVPPIDFSVKCTYGDKTVEVSQFNSYVERTVAIPEGVDPSKITTAIVVDADGTVRHVPTTIIVIDGKYHAKINSLTNSTYSVIWNPLEFKDAEKHWAKNTLNDMGSRMVITPDANGLIHPDQEITRAEFATVIVKALGLKPDTVNNPYQDVKGTDSYSGHINTATQYKIIAGIGNGMFGPNEWITREQAMAMTARAMDITGLQAQFATGEREQLFSRFDDAKGVSAYARNSVAACIKTGVIAGKTMSTIVPKTYITRAELAAIIQRLLQKSNLI